MNNFFWSFVGFSTMFQKVQNFHKIPSQTSLQNFLLCPKCCFFVVMNLRSLLLVYVLWIGTTQVRGQNMNRKMAWTSMTLTYQLKNNFFFQLDAGIRSTDQLEHIQTVLLKPGLGYRFRNGVSLTTGYNYQLSRVNLGQVSALKLEDQLWQQQLYKKAVGRFQLLERILIEERYLPITALNGTKIEITGRNFVLRSRFMLKAFWHFQSGKVLNGKNYTFLQGESFINMAGMNNVNNHHYDQFRGIGGLGHHFKHVDSEIGLMYRNQLNRNGSEYNDLILQITHFIRF